jgi:hypothetical protein
MERIVGRQLILNGRLVRQSPGSFFQIATSGYPVIQGLASTSDAPR